MDVAAHVGVTNPIASDQTLLRASLLPAIRKNILDNSRHFQSFRLFEIGREIHLRNRELPEEIPHFVAAMYAREGDGSASLFELKRLAECLMDGCAGSPGAARGRSNIPSAPRSSRGKAKMWAVCLSCILRCGIEGRAAILDLDLAKMEKLAINKMIAAIEALRPFSR